MDKTIKTLTEVLQESKKEGTTPYDTTAEVVRIEGQTAWVHIPGGIDETPVSMTIDARVGDIVQVRVSGGRAWITGNASAPPTDDTVAVAARSLAVTADENAQGAQTLSEAAKRQAAAAAKIAADTEQHFWFTSTGIDTGAHITEKTQADFIADPTNGGGNLLARSNGIALRAGMIELATLQQSGMDINTDDGNGNLVNIAHLGYGPGTDSGGGTSDAPYYNLGIRTGTVGNYSVAEGVNTIASGYSSHAEGATNVASGSFSHVEGDYNESNGYCSHAEGLRTQANGRGSHAEGSVAHANGDYSHAEGSGADADGDFSHAQNYNTIADQQYQTAIGKYNTKNNTNNLFAIGNGTADNARSNALTVDWSGNVEASGDLWLENNKFVRTKSADGTKTGSVIGVNNANNVVIGYFGYDNNIGSTLVDGNEVGLYSKGDVKASFNNGTAHCVGTMDSLVREAHSTPTATLAGNTQSGALSATFTKSGYYPLAIAGFQSVGSYGTHVVPSNLRITSASSGSCTISYTLKNTSSSSSTGTGLTVHILWIKV